MLGAASTPVFAQVADPAGAAAAAIARDQARRAAEAGTADRAARENAPQSRLERGHARDLGPFPVETPCFTIRTLTIDSSLPRGLRWVSKRLARYRGRCVGDRGLNYILRDLQAAFLDRGLVTTRAGLPQQDLSSGVLHVAVVPGVEASVTGGSRKARRAWSVASPLHPGDLVNVRALEQGLDQMRRVPGREVSVDLAPGAAPGETVFDLHAKPVRPISAAISVNNFAGKTVGRWQATGQASALDLLGLNEILSGYYNSRVSNPSIPANSTGTGGSFEIPWGWWTFGVAGSINHYGQHVIGQVQDFDTRSTLKTVSGTITRVVNRDRTSKTSVQVQLQRRWGRSYIDDIQIGLQHQDLADVQLAVIDRRRFGRIQFDGVLAYRIGLGILGAQKDQPGQPAELPTSRYRIATLDVALSAPIGERLGYRAAFRGQLSSRPLYGPDLFSVGGPYTVRGYESDRALLARSGWYLRQELSVRVADRVQPYGFVDVGGVQGTGSMPTGIGAGMRAFWKGVNLDAFVAIPLTDTHEPAAVRGSGQFGLSIGWGF